MTEYTAQRTNTARRRGGALLPVLLIVVALAGITVSVFSVSSMRNAEARRTGQETRAFYMAEAGLSDALMTIAVAKREGDDVPQSIGTEDAPVAFQKGDFWCEVVDNGSDSFTVRSHGSAGSAQRVLEARIGPFGESVFDYAIFAGNSSDDPAYELKLVDENRVDLTAAQVTDRTVGEVAIRGDCVMDGYWGRGAQT